LRRDGESPTTLRAEKAYFPSIAPTLGPVSRYFEGEATSEIAIRPGWLRDVWIAIAPDIGTLRPRLEEGDRVFTKAEGKLPPATRDAFLSQALEGLAGSYTTAPPPATFRLLVSPLVRWIWIGVLIVLAGAAIAAWPSPRALRGRVAALYAARVGRAARA
jgi:cytochrome c-type biogenesis protein CcmF